MTFSLVGRCARTGMFGVAITTSSICVGARCPHARARAGAVATQNVTDPVFGPLILGYLADGLSAGAALRRATAERSFLDYRQITVVDRNGETACHSGTRILGKHAEQAGRDCFAAGNLLKSEAVPEAMVRRFEAEAEAHLAPRLLAALEAGLAAGGEAGPVHSAALLVVHEHPFPLVDLRCDWDDDDPVATLRNLWTAYEPQMDAYVARAVAPAAAPSYGVSGDP